VSKAAVREGVGEGSEQKAKSPAVVAAHDNSRSIRNKKFNAAMEGVISTGKESAAEQAGPSVPKRKYNLQDKVGVRYSNGTSEEEWFYGTVTGLMVSNGQQRFRVSYPADHEYTYGCYQWITPDDWEMQLEAQHGGEGSKQKRPVAHDDGGPSQEAPTKKAKAEPSQTVAERAPHTNADRGDGVEEEEGEARPISGKRPFEEGVNNDDGPTHNKKSKANNEGGSASPTPGPRDDRDQSNYSIYVRIWY